MCGVEHELLTAPDAPQLHPVSGLDPARRSLSVLSGWQRCDGIRRISPDRPLTVYWFGVNVAAQFEG